MKNMILEHYGLKTILINKKVKKWENNIWQFFWNWTFLKMSIFYIYIQSIKSVSKTIFKKALNHLAHNFKKNILKKLWPWKFFSFFGKRFCLPNSVFVDTFVDIFLAFCNIFHVFCQENSYHDNVVQRLYLIIKGVKECKKVAKIQ